VNFKSR